MMESYIPHKKMIVNGIMFSASNVKYTILLLLHFPSYQKHYMLDKGS